MEVKCEYCGSLIPDDAAVCPNCGAPNANMNRAAASTPRTIAELEQWYKDRGLPPYETTRFFIGINCKEPKAFGIYQDGDKFIVYKNKADGTRSVRYKGTDEDYAVNELFLKLKSEILNQKEHTQSRQTTSSQTHKKKDLGFNGDWLKSVFQLGAIIIGMIVGIYFLVTSISAHIWLMIGGIVLALLIFFIGRKIFRNHKIIVTVVAFLVLAAAVVFSLMHGHYRHTPIYYWYNDLPYVWYDDDYYTYDYDSNDYMPLSEEDVPDDLRTSSDEYRTGSGSDFGSAPDFTESSHYDDSSWSDSINFSSDNDDHDFDWGSDNDWDFGDTDWDSDW